MKDFYTNLYEECVEVRRAKARIHKAELWSKFHKRYSIQNPEQSHIPDHALILEIHYLDSSNLIPSPTNIIYTDQKIINKILKSFTVAEASMLEDTVVTGLFQSSTRTVGISKKDK